MIYRAQNHPSAALMILVMAMLSSLLAGYAGAIEHVGLKRPVVSIPSPAASSPTSSQADTIWVGYLPGSRSPVNPYGVGAGGVWEFDRETSGTDSTQFWQFLLLSYRSESSTTPDPNERPFWYLSHGNEVNIGNTNLWLDRENRGVQAQNTGPATSAGYLRTGITGYWHVDDMNGVSSQISGLGSAWCGLRGPGHSRFLDRVTGNPLNGDLHRYWSFGGQLINGSWPGYGNQIDQILYHDVTLAVGDGSDVLSFKFRTDMSDARDTETGGSRWYNPDPTAPSSWVANPIDSLMLWVGIPRENVYDINKRWLSEVIDFNQPLATQPQKLFAQHGKAPVTSSDTTVTVNLPGWGAGTTIRLAYQVKTNRQFSDETYNLQKYDSAEGAALLDDVVMNGALIGNFDIPHDITPRALLPGNGEMVIQNPAVKWITTGKPPTGYGHIHNVFDLSYDDPCGALGAPDRLCDLIDNVLVLSDHEDPDHAFFRESWVGAESPTIALYDGSPLATAGVGDPDHDVLRLEYQLYTGTMDVDQAVFWNVGARYHGPGYLQQADEIVPGWSDNIVAPLVMMESDPRCVVFNTGTDLDGIIPPPSQLDSLKVFVWAQTRCSRFGASFLCGKTNGTYFDNIRVGFTGGKVAAITAEFWNLLADTFPFNEGITPGSAAFDTTTALIKQGSNLASEARDEGVIIGDTLVVDSPFASPAGMTTRIDLIFRLKPGPGNYSPKGSPGSPLIEKDPSHPFWATYRASPGPFGEGVHPSGGWDLTTWNSARMDSADNLNLSPLVSRNLGVPVLDKWHGTLHEDDPNYSTLGIPHNICFLVDPEGEADNSNICCSAAICAALPFNESWPPSSYPAGIPTSTIEGTKILPDGYFSPGTHIEYFMRRSDAGIPLAGVSLTPDTTRADQQPALGPHYDGQRFMEVAVLPDLWKDARFGGTGLACMLVIDAADRRGQENSVLGTLDSLGYGKNNGAGRGWWENDPSTSNPDPNDPDNRVFANLGQKGLAFDWFDITGAESVEGDRPGCRLATSPPELADRQCKQGPTPEMLKTYYNIILWMSADLESSTLHDGVDVGEQSDDVGLIRDFLANASQEEGRAVWLAGDGVAHDLATSAGDASALLNSFFGAVYESDNYRLASGNLRTPSAVINLIPEFSEPRPYGFDNSCRWYADVISVNGAVSDAVLAQRYEDSSDGDGAIFPGEYGASVYRPPNNTSRYYTTLFSGFQLPHLRGNGFESTVTDFGRIDFMANALEVFDLCSAVGPVIAVGDLPGAGGARLNFVRGVFPNPSLGGEATVEFSLGQPAEVTIRFYNIAGRLVHEAELNGVVGPNTYRWDGISSTGIRTAPGVYFYRLSAPGIEFQGNDRRMVLLSGN
jgi:hypothetical protein